MAFVDQEDTDMAGHVRLTPGSDIAAVACMPANRQVTVGRLRRAFVATVALACSACAAGDAEPEQPPTTAVTTTAGDLTITVEATASETRGEVCATVTIARSQEVLAIDEECGSTAVPPPLVGGYSISDLQAEEVAYSWGLLRDDAQLSETSQGLTTETAAISLSGVPDCCLVYVAAMSGDSDNRKQAFIKITSPDGNESELVELGPSQ
ncbi:hypothetical protein ACFO6V_08570 [Promicromonospora alba]|uniref:Lipoprotein n=1 Tax=Promicromonospora alba TaxID=1616110 RepID=A0ABV9HD72_9MICO